MLFEIIAKGVGLIPPLIPKDWDESTVVHLEEETFTVTFKGGQVLLARGDRSDADAIVKLTTKWLCDAIDGSADFMGVWRELSEPWDTTIVQKGRGAKLSTLIDLLSRTYKSNLEFKKLLDDFKVNLKVR